VLLAAKEKMLSSFVPWCAETCISAHESEGKKPHQGVATKKSAHFLGHEVCNSTTALGLRGQAALKRIGSRCTGKERDAESGLDDFGARYYSSAMGRFTSPDPLLNSGKPWDPQSWNRYSYVRNNPLARIDPTGLYDLNNTCGANDSKCNKQFNQHAKDLKNGLSNLQNQLKNVKDPAQKARLEASLKALGTEGDHNGVNVGFGATKGGGAGETTPVYNGEGAKETYNVTLDPSKLSSQNDYAIAGAHEGTHVDDINTMLANPAGGALSDFSLEYRGYQTSAYAASALGLPSISMNYDGKSSVIWNGSWGAVDKNITNFVTSFHDKNGKPDHPETTPHNPWPN
jgi:RHS repeat-associated protein